MDDSPDSLTLDECTVSVLLHPPRRGETPHNLVARLSMCRSMCYLLYDQRQISAWHLRYLAERDPDAIMAYYLAVVLMHDRRMQLLLGRMQKMSVEECMDVVAPMPPSSRLRLLQSACSTETSNRLLNSAIYAAIAFCVNKDFERRGSAAVREYTQSMLEGKRAFPSRGDCEVIGLIGRSTCHAFLHCDICPPLLRAAVNARLVYLIAFGDPFSF
jgi:hypothetical protein